MYPVLTLYVESTSNGYINVSSSQPVLFLTGILMYPVLTLHVELVSNGYINVSSSHPVRGVGFERVY